MPTSPELDKALSILLNHGVKVSLDHQTANNLRRPGDSEYIAADIFRKQAYSLLREADILTQTAYSKWLQIEQEKLKCSSTDSSASSSA